MSLKGFLKANVAAPVETVKVVVSDRFKGDDGKPIPWVLRILPAKENSKLFNSRISVQNRSVQVDSEAFELNCIVASVVFPDLADVELQNSYGATSPHELVQAMLTGPEFVYLSRRAQEIQGYLMTPEDLTIKAKN